MKIKVFILIVSLFSSIFLNGCGGGGSTAVDEEMKEFNDRISGSFFPYFAGRPLLRDENGSLTTQSIWYEEKLDTNGSVDANASNMTYIFNSYGKAYLYIEIMDPILLGDYDINNIETQLIIEPLKTVYDLIGDHNDSCVRVRKIVDNNDTNSSDYNFCIQF